VKLEMDSAAVEATDDEVEELTEDEEEAARARTKSRGRRWRSWLPQIRA